MSIDRKQRHYANLIKLLKERRHMVLEEPGMFTSLINFISGVEMGMSFERGEGLISFTNWIRRKEGRHFSASWWFFLLQKNDNIELDASNEAIELFGEYLIETSTSVL